MGEEMGVACEVDGIPVVVDKAQLADIDTLELFYSLASDLDSFDEGEQVIFAVGKITDFAKRIYGAEQWRNIKRSLREDNGGVAPMDTCVRFIFDSLSAAAEAERSDVKNS